MSSKKDPPYKCSLSAETLKKAESELNENPDNRMIEVDTLRQRLLKVPGLKPRTDTLFLLGFLRGCCFDQEKTFEQVKNYYQIKKEKKDIFDDLKPSRIKHVIESNTFEVLRHRDYEGRRVIISRMNRWDPDSFGFTEILKQFALYVTKLMEDEETQVHGVRLISHVGGLTVKQMAAISPMQGKLTCRLAFNCFPLHLRRNDTIYENKLFDVFFAIFSQFMDDELLSRVHFLGKNPEKLFETMNPDYLPTDVGGNEEPFCNTEWVDEILGQDKFFEENNKYGFLTMDLQNEKREKTKENAGMQGMGGSFKKLEI